LKAILIMSLQEAFDAAEPSQQTATPTHNKIDPTEEINGLESKIAKHCSPRQRTALEQLNKVENMIPFLQKLNSISKEDSSVAHLTDILLTSLQFDYATISSPASKNTITLPPLSTGAPPDDSSYEYVGPDIYNTPFTSFPDFGGASSLLQADMAIPQDINLYTPSQSATTTPQYTTPTVETNVTPQTPLSSSSTPMADNKPSRHYDAPGSVVRMISFTGTIGGQATVKSTAPSESGTKEKVEDLEAMFPPLSPDQ
jgi:hypothetical protein